jgi:2,5-diamino-6-(ribosylamino)-4(3H)-pyrimidinone 5'-phosphate reductase
MVSVDGRTDHLAADIGLYYEIAASLPQDAVLSGSGTLLAAAIAEGIDIATEDDVAPPSVASADAAAEPTGSAPLLFVVYSGGQLTRFGWLQGLPYWRAILVAGSEATPRSHLDLLDRHGITHHVVGRSHVDLERLLRILRDEYGVEHVRVDSGGVLNGALLRAGLVDEISLLVVPSAVGGRSPASLFVADDLLGEPVGLELRALERLRDDIVWLRYAVVGTR